MKNKLSILALITLIAAGVFVFIKKNKKTTLSGDDSDFTVPDTASIDKLFLANKKGATALLEKDEKGNWTINGKYPARKDAIHLLMITFLKTQIKFPAPQNAQENMLRNIAANGVKCEIYQHKKLSKIWYIGHETQDLRGTYCLLQGAENEQPYNTVYAIEIPGFIGTIVPRFFFYEEEWREKQVLALTPDKIKNITLNLIGYPDTSFTINVEGLHRFNLTTLSGKQIMPFDTGSVKQYLSYFMNLNVEGWLTNTAGLPQADSVRKSNPYLQLSVTNKDNKTETFKFYKKPLEEGYDKDEKGNKLPYDPEHMYMKFKNDQEFAEVSITSWGKLFQSPRYFMPKQAAKK